MRISIRTLGGPTAEVDAEPSWTVAELKKAVEEATNIPVADQRLIYAGAQLEEVASESFRQRRSLTGNEVSEALGVTALPVGAPLRLDHYAMQKGSVVMVARRAVVGSGGASSSGSGNPSSAPVATSAAAASAPATASGGEGEASHSAAGMPTGELQRSAPGKGVAMAGAPNSVPTGPVLSWEQARVEDLEADQRRRSAGYGGQSHSQAVSSGVVAGSAAGAGPQWAPSLGPSARGSCNASAPADASLVERLDALGDLELHATLGPLLRRRPALLAALLADVQASPTVAAVSAEAPRIQPSAPGVADTFAYSVGDNIIVWSNSAQQWYPGTVTGIARETDGKIPQGSVEASFLKGRKWIPPAEVPTVLRRR